MGGSVTLKPFERGACGVTTPAFPAEDLPDGWRVWSRDPDGRVVVAFRPDVFDASEFPAPCLPTIYVSNGSPRRRPGAGSRTTDEWHVTLFLEPDVDAGTERFDDRETACANAVERAERFADGDVDYRALYQVPREAYFAELDRLVGRNG